MKMSQKDLAKRSGLTPQAINRYLKGRQFPRKSFLLQVAEALGCEKEDLLGLTSTINIPQDIVEALGSAPQSRLDDIRLLLRLPEPRQAPRSEKKKA
jgi:transcriptional regulator with XRE-family HTH domain